MKPEERGHIPPMPTSKAEAVQQAEAAFAQLAPNAAGVARRLVVMHWFDESVIAALLSEGAPEEERSAVVAAITTLPFVEAVPPRHAYQRLARQGLLERYQEERPEELKAACKAAAAALAKGWEDDTTALELVYCLLVAGEPKDAQNQLHELLVRFLERQDWERCSALYAAVAEAEALSFARPLPRTADYYLLRGMARGAQGKLLPALKDLNKALERQPTLAWAVAQRGEVHARMGHADAALADMARAAFMDRQVVDALAVGGSLNRLMEEYQQEPAAFPQAKMEGLSKLAEGLGARGEVARLEGRDEEALAYFQRALTLVPDLAWVYASRGALYMNRERSEEALAETSRAIELDPNYAWALANRGRIYRSLDRDEQAMADLNRALQLDPKMSGAFAERGEIHRKHGRLDEALEDLEQALRLNSLNAWAAARRGQVLKAKGRYLDALAEMHRAIALSPTDDAWALTTRGELHVYFENWGDALSDFSRAIELQPDNAEAITDRAQVYQELESYEQAAADFAWLIERHPELTWAFVQRGRAYLGQQRYAEALADLDEALGRSADDQEALSIRGQTYYQMGCYDKALADLGRAIALDPQDHLALANRAEVWLRQGGNEPALADLDAALTLRPEDDWSLFRRALVRQALGKATQAEVDMAAAIEGARKRYAEEPKDWPNTLNLALYEFTAGRAEEAERLYRQALAEGALASHIRQALSDLEEFLALRPGQERAAELRELLQGAAAEVTPPN